MLQNTIQECIRKTKPRLNVEWWWNNDLNKMKRKFNKLKSQLYKFCTLNDHPSHQEFKKASNLYGEAIIHAKWQHWINYLEEMTAADIWTTNKYIKELPGDGGCPCIPTLKTRNEEGAKTYINNNQDKAKLFTKAFFPTAPETPINYSHYNYPEPLLDSPQITPTQLERHVAKLSPYKVHGLDGIPNIVRQKSINLISNWLLIIFRAILKHGIYYDQWREFTTIVLRKPNKPNYKNPKAYQPIALISTIAKVLTSIVAENLSQVVEQHQILPKTHFGNRPGRSTTDAAHYLIYKILTAWQSDKVASVLFLDIEGTFPNTMPAQLIHNLKRRKILTTIITFVELLLINRRTKLQFDDFTSDTIMVTNGIGQDNPLSMLLYILYNSDLLDISNNPLTDFIIGYVDDIAIIAIGANFEETTQWIKDMMTKDGGGLQWSTNHNSCFEVSKSAIATSLEKPSQTPTLA